MAVQKIGLCCGTPALALAALACLHSKKGWGLGGESGRYAEEPEDAHSSRAYWQRARRPRVDARPRPPPPHTCTRSPPALQTQEIWSFAIPAAWLLLLATPAQLARAAAPGNALPLALFLVHYFNRDIIYPLRLRGGKPTPFVVWLSAAAFCIYNGYMQVRRLEGLGGGVGWVVAGWRGGSCWACQG